jgi:hypothetical protein
MTLQQYGGLSFESPPGWIDKPILTFTAPGRVDTNLVATRETRSPGETIVTHARRQLLQLATRLPDFEVLETEDLEVAGRPATCSRYRWRGAKGVVEQTLAHVDSPEDDTTVLCFTCTARPESEFRSWVVLRQLLATARFDAGRAAPIDSGFFDIDDLPRVPVPGGHGRTR